MAEDVKINVVEDTTIIGGCAGAGALIGSCVPVIGTAIGTGIGAIVGGVAVIAREVSKRKQGH